MPTDIQRIRREVAAAAMQFALVEAHPTSDGGVYVKSVMQTSTGKTYFLSIYFPDYPNQMPKVMITNPTLRPTHNNHMYKDGYICFLHPNMWNPGRHLGPSFLPARIAKWLNKYDCWSSNGGHLARRRGAPLMPLDFALLSMTELRNRPGEILDRVADKGEVFIIERNGQRKACLVPLSILLPDIPPATNR